MKWQCGLTLAVHIVKEYNYSDWGSDTEQSLGKEIAKHLLYKINKKYIGNASWCHSGTHQAVVVGCPVERGAVTSEVSGATFEVGEGSVQRGLIHWSHPEEVVTEQEKGWEWRRFTPQLVYTWLHAYMYCTDDESLTCTCLPALMYCKSSVKCNYSKSMSALYMLNSRNTALWNSF